MLVLAATGQGPVGNQFLTTDEVFRQGRKVGDDASVCQVVAEPGHGSRRFQCVATVSLPEGQLTAQGLATVTDIDDASASSPGLEASTARLHSGGP